MNYTFKAFMINKALDAFCPRKFYLQLKVIFWFILQICITRKARSTLQLTESWRRRGSDLMNGSSLGDMTE